MSYFGTDQSQVQRYLTARSVDEARVSLFMSAYWKIPLQALVLLIGVFVFVFYLFTPPPMLFNAAHEQAGAREPAGGRLCGARAAIQPAPSNSADRRRNRLPNLRGARETAAASPWPTSDSRAGTTRWRPFVETPSRWSRTCRATAPTTTSISSFRPGSRRSCRSGSSA